MHDLATHLFIDDEVKACIQEKRPVVALETAVLSHGLPHPTNIEQALKLEEIVRKGGATPATCALIDGKIKVGLKEAEIVRLGDVKSNESVSKVSRRDIPYILTEKKLGATTVSATMVAASLAGISLMATGGIGGVHYGGHLSFDISCDLYEMSQTNVAVVCSGAKSILDIEKTLEVLETLGVPVVGYKTNVFPGFYSSESRFPLEYQFNDPDQIAKLLETKWNMGLVGSIIIANPVPKSDELSIAFLDRLLEKALRFAEENKITGKAVTPFLLHKLNELSNGKTLSANVALLQNNAALASQISCSFEKVKGMR